jgi:hypothetical protein
MSIQPDGHESTYTYLDDNQKNRNKRRKNEDPQSSLATSPPPKASARKHAAARPFSGPTSLPAIDEEVETVYGPLDRVFDRALAAKKKGPYSPLPAIDEDVETVDRRPLDRMFDKALASKIKGPYPPLPTELGKRPLTITRMLERKAQNDKKVGTPSGLQSLLGPSTASSVRATGSYSTKGKRYSEQTGKHRLAPLDIPFPPSTGSSGLGYSTILSVPTNKTSSTPKPPPSKPKKTKSKPRSMSHFPAVPQTDLMDKPIAPDSTQAAL